MKLEMSDVLVTDHAESDFFFNQGNHFIHLKMIASPPQKKIKQKQKNKKQKRSVGKDIEKVCSSGGTVKWYSCYRRQCFLKSLKTELPYNQQFYSQVYTQKKWKQGLR